MELPDLGEHLNPILPGELDVDDRQPRLLLGQRPEEIVPVDVPTRDRVTRLGQGARHRIAAERLTIE